MENLETATTDDLALALNEAGPAVQFRARRLLEQAFSDESTPLPVLESFRKHTDKEVAFCSSESIINRIQNGKVAPEDLQRLAQGNERDEQFSVAWTAKHFIDGNKSINELLQIAVDEKLRQNTDDVELAETIIHEALQDNAKLNEEKLKRFQVSPDTFTLVLIKLASEKSVHHNLIPLILNGATRLGLDKNFFFNPEVQKLAIDVALSDYIPNGNFDEVLTMLDMFGFTLPEDKYNRALAKYTQSMEMTPVVEKRIVDLSSRLGFGE